MPLDFLHHAAQLGIGVEQRFDFATRRHHRRVILPPNLSPSSGKLALQSLRARYIATCRGFVTDDKRLEP